MLYIALLIQHECRKITWFNANINTFKSNISWMLNKHIAIPNKSQIQDQHHRFSPPALPTLFSEPGHAQSSSAVRLPPVTHPCLFHPRFPSLMASTGDDLGRRGGAHFASEKHYTKIYDRGCNYDKQWEEESCCIHSTSWFTWIMPKDSLWILMCWGLGGWGNAGLLRKEPEHCQSIFFIWLI